MDDAAPPLPAWSQPDSLGHATARRLLNAGVIAAAPAMPRIRQAASIGERHLAFVDSLSVAASLRAASVVAADDPRVFRGASRRASGAGDGDAWPAPAVARTVVWPLARTSGARNGTSGPQALEASGDPAPPGAPAAVARAAPSPAATLSAALPATPGPAAVGVPGGSDPSGTSSAAAMPVTPAAVLRRSDLAARAVALPSSALGGAGSSAGSGSPQALPADDVRVDPRSNEAATIAPAVRPVSPRAAAGAVSGETPLARAARRQEPGATPARDGFVATPGSRSAADGAARVMPFPAPTGLPVSLPWARPSGSPSGSEGGILDGGSGSGPASANHSDVARFASRATVAGPAQPSLRPAAGPEPAPTTAGSTSGEALRAAGVGTVGGLAKAAAPPVELALRIPRVPAHVQAVPPATVAARPAVGTIAAQASHAAASSAAPAVAGGLATPPEGAHRDGFLPLPAADHATPARPARREARSTASDAPGATPALAGGAPVLARHASAASAGGGGESVDLPIVRASAALRSGDDTPGAPTLARRPGAVAPLPTAGAPTEVGLPMRRLPQLDSVATRSPAATPAPGARSPTIADTTEHAPEPGHASPLAGPAGDAAPSTAHRRESAAPPLVLARAIAAAPVPGLAGAPGFRARAFAAGPAAVLPATPDILAQASNAMPVPTAAGVPTVPVLARQAPAGPSIAMPLAAHRAPFGSEAAAANPPSIARAGAAAASPSSLIDPSPTAAAPSSVQHAAASTPHAAAIDVDDLVERTCQAVFARLVVEQERRGYARWA